jgi:hypothetical protein
MNPHVALRLLFAPIVGIAALSVSCRLMPGEDPDVLVRAAIDTTIAGLCAGAAANTEWRLSAHASTFAEATADGPA